MHCVQYIWNIDIMQARARLLERKMEEDQVRRTLRYLAKVETVDAGMPAAFRAGQQAKLSARGTDDADALRETVEARARREYEEWLQQRMSASLEPS